MTVCIRICRLDKDKHFCVGCHRCFIKTCATCDESVKYHKKDPVHVPKPRITRLPDLNTFKSIHAYPKANFPVTTPKTTTSPNYTKESFMSHTMDLPVTLATLKEGGRDGTLIVISPDHKTYFNVRHSKKFMSIAFQPTLQNALEAWDKALPILHEISENLAVSPGTPLPDFSKFHSPLPRAYQWLDGSAYVNHVELVRKARGAEMPPSFWTDPLMYQGASDQFVGPHDTLDVASEDYGIDFEAEIAVITDDVPMGVTREDAARHIKLLMLVNDVSLRGLIPAEIAKGFGFIHGKPACAFSPFVITPAVLGDKWKDTCIQLPLTVEVKRKDDETYQTFGAPLVHHDMTFNMAKLVAHGAHTRHLHAGTIVGSGTISNLDRSKGSCCLAEKRMLEVIEHGDARTPFLKFGDAVRISMEHYFGTIEQVVAPYTPKK